MSRKTSSLFLAIILFCTVVVGDDPKNDPDDGEGRAKILEAAQAPVRQLDGYQKWPMLTTGAVNVAEGTYFLCNTPVGAFDSSTKIHGPHWSPAIRVYANAKAKAAIDAKKKEFPPGSIIVKEKLLHKKIDAITAMIREQDGYDKSEDQNNWRYLYISKNEDMQFGRIETCRKCHKKAAETDFAFLKYTDSPGYSSGP